MESFHWRRGSDPKSQIANIIINFDIPLQTHFKLLRVGISCDTALLDPRVVGVVRGLVCKRRKTNDTCALSPEITDYDEFSGAYCLRG